MVRTAEEAQAAAVTLGEEAQAKEAAEIAAEAAVVTLAAEVAAALVTTEAEVQTSQAAKARAAAVEGRASGAASETEDEELRADPLPQSEAGAAAASAAELEAGAAAVSAAELEAGAAAVSAAELEVGAAAASAAAAEQEARAQWIAYHLSVSELEEARELGWTGDEASAAAEVAAAAVAAAAAAAAMPAASAVGRSIETDLTMSAEEDEDEEDGEEDEVDEEEAIARLLAPSALARANAIAGHVEGAYGRAITMTGRPPSAEPPMAGSPDRAQWIAYHLSVGELAEARELGWVDDEAAAQAAWGEAAEAAEAAAAAAHHRQSAVGWLATWGEATAARLDRKMAAEGEALGEAAEPGLVDAAVGWLANLFSPRAAVGVAMTEEEEEEEVARRRAATVVQAVARGRVARHSRDFGISGARPAELEVGTSSTRDRNLEELRGSGSPYIQRICSRSGSPYDSPDMQRDMQRSAGSPVQAHLDRVAQEVSRSPAPGESTEAMVRRFSPVGLPVLHAPPSPPALVAGYVAPAVARRELHFEADVASSVSQAVMLQAWGRVLLAKVRVRTAKRDYRQQALAQHVRAKSAARIQIAYRSPDRPPRATSAPPSSPPSAPPSSSLLSSQQRRAAARRRSEGTPLPLLPSPATDARRAALLYSASPGRSPGWSPTARPTGPPSLPKPSPQRAQTLKRLMAQARLGRSLIGLTRSPVARRTTCASSRLVSPLAPLAVTPTSHPTSPSHFTWVLAAAATHLTSGLSFRL